MGDLTANLIKELLVGILAREFGDALELGGLPGHKLVELRLALLDLTRLARELVLALIEGIVAAIERFLALHDAVLERAELFLALLLLSLGSLLALDDLFLGLKQGLFL